MMEPLDRQQLITDLFQAYFDARKNKRNTINALMFEKNFESNIFNLFDEIVENRYEPHSSICFVVDKPVKREIFAADFRDRVVHHYIINRLNPLFEKSFIYDSYSCRSGKGTHLGIQRIDRFIRQCSRNYSMDCYILKLDIKGFFMHIDRTILFNKLQAFIHQKFQQDNKSLLLELCHKIIHNDPSENCVIKCSRSHWVGLPPDKSLFHSPPGCGLPIGNLTSQVFANFYLNVFDHFVKYDLGMRYYGRYVDDFIIVHRDREYLKEIVATISDFLRSSLKLDLHPNKVDLQHYNKGVQFLGTIIQPYRLYIANHTKGNFYQAIGKQNRIARDHKPERDEQKAFLSSMNSYLGIMKHYKTYKLRKRMIFKYLSGWWWNHVYLTGGFAKFVMKRKSAASNW